MPRLMTSRLASAHRRGRCSERWGRIAQIRTFGLVALLGAVLAIYVGRHAIAWRVGASALAILAAGIVGLGLMNPS